MSNISADQLQQFIDRIETLEDERRGVADDIRDVYNEMKGEGYDTKIVKKIIRLRRMTREARIEEETLLETYQNAIGMV